MMDGLIGPLVASILTLFVLSYVIGENPLYRFVLHLLVGILVGYSLGIVVREVLLDMALPELQSSPVAMVVPLVLGLLLLLKGIPRLSHLGNTSMAYLIGVGAAVALGGALLGTLGPQMVTTSRALAPAAANSLPLGVLDGLMVVVGTVCTLLVFTFSASEREEDTGFWQRITAGPAWIGRVFLTIAFALSFAGALTASLSILVARMHSVIEVALKVLGP